MSVLPEISVDDLTALHDEIVATYSDTSPEPTADHRKKLEACIGRAVSYVSYDDSGNAPEVVFAAVLLHAIASLNPYVDGNKRLAWSAATLALRQADYSLDPSPEHQSNWIVRAVDERFTAEQVIDQFVRWLR